MTIVEFLGLLLLSPLALLMGLLLALTVFYYLEQRF